MTLDKIAASCGSTASLATNRCEISPVATVQFASRARCGSMIRETLRSSIIDGAVRTLARDH